EAADGGDGRILRQRRHKEADRGEAGEREREAEERRAEQTEIERAAGEERQRHQRDERDDEQQEQQHPEIFSKHDLGHRYRRAEEQRQGAIAAFFRDQPHGEQRHDQEQDDGGVAEQFGNDDLGGAGRVFHGEELSLKLLQQLDAAEKHQRENRLQRGEYRPREGRQEQTFELAPGDGEDHHAFPGSGAAGSVVVSSTKICSSEARSGAISLSPQLRSVATRTICSVGSRPGSCCTRRRPSSCTAAERTPGNRSISSIAGVCRNATSNAADFRWRARPSIVSLSTRFPLLMIWTRSQVAWTSGRMCVERITA